MHIKFMAPTHHGIHSPSSFVKALRGCLPYIATLIKHNPQVNKKGFTSNSTPLKATLTF
jgi:hypothetical protein